jgi:hypothetical protein
VAPTLQSVGSVSLCSLLSSTVCPLPVSGSNSIASWFSVTIFTAVFYSLSTACQWLNLYSLLVLCHYVHCCLLQPVHSLSVAQIVPSVGSVSLCSLLSSTVCQLSVSTSLSICWPSPHCRLPCCSNTVCCFTVTTVTLISVIFRQRKGVFCCWLRVLSGHYMSCIV